MTMVSFIRALLAVCHRDTFTSLLDGSFLARGAHSRGARLRAAAVLLGLFAATHLTAGAAIHLLNRSNDSAVDASNAAVATSAAEAPSRIDVGEPHANDLLPSETEPAEDARTCRIGLLLDSDCLFD